MNHLPKLLLRLRHCQHGHDIVNTPPHLWRRLYCSAPGYTASPQALDNGNTMTTSVALVGAPNAGKSSLSNALLRSRVSAVSRKVNTTRSRTSGAFTDGNRQLLLWDTPGLVERAFVRTLGPDRRNLTTDAWGAAADADVAVFVVDSSRSKRYLEHYAVVAHQLTQVRQRVKNNSDDKQEMYSILVMNKIDCVRPRNRVLETAQLFREKIDSFSEHFLQDVFFTSAYNGRGVDGLRQQLLELATPGEFEAPPGVSHLDEDLELIRQHLWEKLLHRVHQEVPYRCQFENEAFVERPDGSLFVSERIIVPSRSTAAIVVGPGGSVIEWIKDSAEESATKVLGHPLKLKLQQSLALVREMMSYSFVPLRAAFPLYRLPGAGILSYATRQKSNYMIPHRPLTPRTKLMTTISSPPSPSSPPPSSRRDFLREKGYRTGDKVLLFDGICVFCNAGVDFVLRNEASGEIKFAALQSEVGRALLAKFDCPDDLSTVVYVENERAFVKSEAVLRVGMQMGWYFQLPAQLALLAVPRPVRDFLYTDVVAKNRYNIFGKRDECRMVEPGQEHRFLE